MWTFLKKTFGSVTAWLMQYFKSGKAAADAQWALEHMHEALPIVGMVADIATAVIPTPGEVDNVVWKAVKAKYPSLWDGSLKTDDEFKLYALGVATELFKQRFPAVDTTRARMAVQNAYADYRNIQATGSAA
jgi:hypothetical protein